MTSKTDQINELLSRAIEKIIPSSGALKKALAGDKPLSVYLGVDPTAPNLHLGHAAGLFVLKRFQKLGHKITLLIGDFTARIGDPSGKDKTRRPLSRGEVLQNAKTYKEQASKILDFDSSTNPATLVFNSNWHAKLKFRDILDLGAHFSVQQMLARDMFEKRMKEARPIGLNEFLYPLMQGYDSVALKTDVEVGGSDQLFNMLVGRDLVKKYLSKEKFAITTRLLVNPITGAKMSKSEGHLVSFEDPPGEMYAKIMAFPDALIWDCFTFCTEVPLRIIEDIKTLPPRDAKARLAREIVLIFHGGPAANKAEAEFQKVFVFDRAPSNIPLVRRVSGATSTTRVLVDAGMSSSKSEATRLVKQGGVHIQAPGKEWETAGETINVQDNMVIRVGKRKFRRVKTKNKGLKNSL